MRKRVLMGIMFAAIGMITHSCKKSTGTAFTNATMKPWFDSHCASCHAGGSGGWTYNPSNYESSIKANIQSIYNEVYVRKTMPPAGITNAELNKFKTWYDSGYAAN